MKFAHRSAISCKLNADYSQRYCTKADAAAGSRGAAAHLEERNSRKAGSDCMEISSIISYSIMNNSEANISSSSSSSSD